MTRSLALLVMVGACHHADEPPAEAPAPEPGDAPAIVPPEQAKRALAADAAMIAIPAGAYVAGSTPDERAAAYAAANPAAREQHWFDAEAPRTTKTLPAFWIDRTPVTNAAYQEYVATGAALQPKMDADTWALQGFSQDFATQVARAVWQDGAPPAGREQHPVTLVTWAEAARYCAWRGAQAHRATRLPTADELEKAARGEHGAIYPWGDAFDGAKLDGQLAAAPGDVHDTTPVGAFAAGASPYGALDLAGNVFQWTSTPAADGKMIVKGSAWDDGAGVGRGASAHGRPRTVRHVIIGFRCAASEAAR